ncbi:hypothetical protein [Micromonospora sp. Llam0]|uniref:hypothetical protein n=1 Tax=Micromonospora sp. Llam0 TaxID=2485143 RepID=UPI001315905C|nr:hypothetical protein [Micromonospora sp. Llam0]
MSDVLQIGSLAVPVGALVIYAVGFVVLYWVIRLAVRHAIRDADQRRSGERR